MDIPFRCKLLVGIPFMTNNANLNSSNWLSRNIPQRISSELNLNLIIPLNLVIWPFGQINKKVKKKNSQHCYLNINITIWIFILCIFYLFQDFNSYRKCLKQFNQLQDEGVVFIIFCLLKPNVQDLPSSTIYKSIEEWEERGQYTPMYSNINLSIHSYCEYMQ